MNVLLAVNEKAIEKYVADMKECNVLKVIKNKKNLLNDVLELNPHVVLISSTLPGKESIEDIITSIKVNQKHTRIIYLYGSDDGVRKQFTNFLIENNVYDFHVGAINEEVINDLILNPKKQEDVKLEILTEEESEYIETQLKAKREFLEQLRESLRQEYENVTPGGTDEKLSEDEIEDRIEEQLITKSEKNLEVQIINRIEEIERIVEIEKVVEKTVYETKVIRQEVYSILGLYNTTKKDLFLSNLSSLLASREKRNILIIDFETPFPTLDHHFNIDKYINIDELHTSKRLTGVSGCISAIKKNILTNSTFKQFVKKIDEQLYILTGMYDIDDFDNVQMEDVKSIIDAAKENFDTVILSLNSFISNTFTYTSIINSTKVMLVSEDTYTNARANINLIKEMSKYHEQDINKFNIVIFGNNIDNDTEQKLYEGYRLLGKISENDKYIPSLIDKSLFIKKYAKKKQVNEYMKILTELGYVPKISKWEKIMSKFVKGDEKIVNNLS